MKEFIKDVLIALVIVVVITLIINADYRQGKLYGVYFV